MQLRTCRRCGLPRRRTLLTPDGKTFSFPGFAVRRHRGLLLASGAACCCACTEFYVNPIQDISNNSWEDTTGGDGDGLIWDDLDGVDGVASGSYIRRTVGPSSIFEVKLATPPTNGWLGTTSHKVFVTGVFTFGSMLLLQGATTIRNGGSGFLTEAEYNSITDFSDLRIKLTVDFNNGDVHNVGYREICP